MDKFLKPKTHEEQQRQLADRASKLAHLTELTAEQRATADATRAEKQAQKRAQYADNKKAKRKADTRHKPHKRQAAQISTPATKKKGKRGKYTNWWHPLIIAPILAAIAQKDSARLAVQSLQKKHGTQSPISCIEIYVTQRALSLTICLSAS